jgi:hypothetical protein
MEELEPAIVEVAEKKLAKAPDPIEIYRRNIHTMSNRQMSNHLRRKARQKGSMTDGTWAIILSTIFDNTKTSQVGGKIESYLR